MTMGLQERVMSCKGWFISFLFITFLFHIDALSFNDFQNEKQIDAQALHHFKISVTIDPTLSLSNWVAENKVCNWTGITCDDDERVVSVVLKYKALSGQIPPHVGNISFLTTLDLSNNFLSGPVPQQLGKLEKLQYLNLAGNHLQGPIPPSLGACTRLLQFRLHNNFLSGSIPVELSSLPNLERLMLGPNNLTGVIPQQLINCSALKTLHLGWNLLTGLVPSNLGVLSDLRGVNIENNQLSGEIPKSLSNCTRLRYLLLSSNGFEGSIPEDIGYNLPRLQEISLRTNNLIGRLPRSIGNCSGLHILRAGYNKLSGVLPRELGMLSRLQVLGLGVNRFHGEVFPLLLNFTQLREVHLTTNRFVGSIPVNIGLKLTKLQIFSAGGNLFSAEIPKSLGNCSQLSALFLYNNRLTGAVPQELGMLTALKRIFLWNNTLSNGSSATKSVLDILTNCSNLREIYLSLNDFSGTLSGGIGKLSPGLSVLYLGSNDFTGNITEEIGNLTALTFLSLENNNLIGKIRKPLGLLKNLQELDLSWNTLQGSIPPEFSMLVNLEYLWLGLNSLSGEIPSSMSSLQQLRNLDLSYNELTGRIPAAIGQFFRLEMIDLSHNRLTEDIPVEISSLRSLTFYLNFSHNSLTGRLPSLGEMHLIQAIDISANKLSGHIPGDTGSCVGLQHLNLSKNKFNGVVPTSIGQLKSLEGIDLSFNKLSGPVPPSIANLTMLRLLNFSYNNLSGSVPNQGAFRNLNASSFLQNPRLCAPSGWLNLPNCTSPAGIHPDGFNWKVVARLSIVIFLASCCLVGAFYIIFRKIRREPFTDSLLGKGFMQISSQVLHTATDGFSASNLLGAGSFGSVYRGLLSDNTLVAVKVFHQDVQNSYKNLYRECRIQRKIRHRNLVRVLSCCSTPELRALVLEFMSKGSLEQQLHQGCILSLKMRLNIALDVAHAMAYLHHDCCPPVVHFDLKPSNVLMDENMTAHVADFGIARLMISPDFANSSSTSKPKGTVGYLAPEYGLGAQITTKMDVYSFGVLVLEMVTRKRPSDEMFSGNKTLPNWVRRAFPEGVEEVVDREMLIDELCVEVSPESAEEGKNKVVSLIGMALQCTRHSPGERPTMREVESVLERIVYSSSYGSLEDRPSVATLLTPVKGLGHPNNGASSSSIN